VHRLQRAFDALVERVDTPSPILLVDVMHRNIDRMQVFAAPRGTDRSFSGRPALAGTPGRGTARAKL
jgi:hypothetical protein